MNNLFPEEKADDEIEREPVYYYNRERRLSRASRRVRDFNVERPTQRGLTKSIFGFKGNILILASILMICAMFAISSRFSGDGSTVKLGENSVTLNIIKEEGIQILSIEKKGPKKGEAYSGEVDIAVSPVMSNYNENVSIASPDNLNVFAHRIFFHPVEFEIFSFSMPFDVDVDGNEYYVVLKTNDEIKSIKISAVGSK